MRSKNCQAIRRQIEEAELDQYSSQDLAAHLRDCAACREFERERASLKRLLGSLETVQAPADFDFRLRARLTASRGARRRQGLSKFLPAPSVPAIALAASFALLVAAAVIFKQLQHAAPRASDEQNLATLAAPAPSSSAPSGQAPEARPVNREPSAGENGANVPGEAALKSAATGPAVLTAELKPHTRQNRSARPADERAVPVATAATVAVVAAGPKNSSLEFSSRPAPVFSIVVPVPATTQPTKVSLEDGRGTTRTVSLPPVTFGSQELIERHGASRVLTSATDGIW